MARSAILLTITFSLTLSLNADADWPTDPSSALVVGPINNGFDERAALRSGAHGSVWIAWQEAYCVGDVLLQRIDLNADLLAPGGLAIQPDPTCGFHLEPSIAIVDDDAVVTRRMSLLSETPVQRYDGSGAALWAPAFTTVEPLSVELIEPIDASDVLVISRASSTIRVDRLGASGAPVWNQQLSIPSNVGSNFGITGFVPDTSGGGYVFWESPATYVRNMRVMRITGDGSAAWTGSTRIVDVIPPDRGASRHTHARMAPDGGGGAIVVYTEGFEQGTSAAALFMQRVEPNGSLAFPKPGVRVSTRTERQFDVDLEHEPITNDIFMVWRDALQEDQAVRAQRMSVDGSRLWNDQGVHLAPLDDQTGSYDGVLVEEELKTAVGAPDSVTLVRTSAGGIVDPDPVLVSNDGPSSFVKAARSLRGVVVAWQRNNEGPDDAILAQRVNRDNELGGQPCDPDLNDDGELDFFDISELLASSVDYNGDTAFDFFDISAFLQALMEGCP